MKSNVRSCRFASSPVISGAPTPLDIAVIVSSRPAGVDSPPGKPRKFRRMSIPLPVAPRFFAVRVTVSVVALAVTGSVVFALIAAAREVAIAATVSVATTVN